MKNNNTIINILYAIMLVSFMQSRRLFSLILYWDFSKGGWFESFITIFSIIFYIAAVTLLVIKREDVKKNYKQILFIFISFILTRSLFLNLILILIFFARYVKRKTIIKVYMITQVTVLIIALLCIPLAVNPEGLGRKEIYLGFSHINGAAVHIFSIVTGLVYIYKDSKKLPYITFIGIAICFMFSTLTGSRSIMFSSSIFLLLLIPNNFFNRYEKIVKHTRYLFIPVVFIIFIATVILTVNFDYSLLDEFTSTRLRLFKYYIELMEGQYIFGKEWIFVRAEYPKALDSSYIHIFYQSGIVGIILVSIIVGHLIRQLYRKNKFSELIIIMAFLVYNSVEAIWDLEANFIIIIAMCYVSDKFQKEKLTNEKN